MTNKINKMPKHIAIIPDGNRRWARKRSKRAWEGHEAGAKTTERLIREALKSGIENLTLWGSSEDNLRKRPLSEKRALLKIYEQYFKKLIKSDEIYQNQARIRVIGKWEEQFPKSLIRILNEGMKKTKRHSKCFLTFLLAYNGDDDVLFAAKRIAQKAHSLKKQFVVTRDVFSSSLMSSALPDVDLVIRTGVENDPHNSAGFLMWQTQNSQQYYSNLMFPDFTPGELRKAIVDFSKRKRRLGK